MLLAGDIGGTKTHLAMFSLAEGPRRPVVETVFSSAHYVGLADMVREFTTQTQLPIEYACFDVAGPVTGGRAQLTCGGILRAAMILVLARFWAFGKRL